MKRFKQSMLSVVITGLLATLVACGGGGGGGSSSNDDDGDTGGGGGGTADVTGLAMPTKLSVVTAVDTPSGKVSGLSLRYGAIARAVNETLPSNSDYAQDQTRTYVHDESMNTLETVNMILCLMDQTKASDMVNEGAYIALINEDKCEEGKNTSGAAQGGQTNTTNVTKLNRWTIVSTRADEDSPQRVKIWMPGEADAMDPMDGQNIMIDVTVTQAASDTKPFGAFTLNFQGIADAGLVQTGTPNGQMMTIMKGTLIGGETNDGKPHFQFINLGGGNIDPNMTDFSMEEAADVVLNDATGTGGVAKLKEAYYENKGGNAHESDDRYVVAFGERYMLRGLFDDADTMQSESCLDREDFNTHVWQYNLYNGTTGARISLNSGIPFTYTAGEDKIQGHVGYWGLWMENETYLSQMDGASVVSHDWNTNQDTTYTLRVAPGKTIKRKAHPMDMAELDGSEFNTWMNHPTLGYPNENNFDSWVVSADGSTGKFKFVKGVTWGNNGPVFTDLTLSDQVEYTPTWDGENLWLWSDSLGGNVVYVFDQTTPTASKVTFYSQENIYPNDTNVFAGGATSVSLWCFDRCPKGGVTQGQIGTTITNEWDLFYTPNYMTPTYLSYTLSLESGKIVLRDGSAGNAVVDASNLDLSSIGISWGLSSGEMVTTAIKDTLTNPWEIFQADESFRWETGAQSWNRLVTVTTTGGQLLSFDKPIQFTYQVDAGDVLNPSEAVHAGKTFMLEYGGEGQLWGFPWEADPNCSDTTGENCRWYAQVNLKNGVVLSNDDGSYVVKGIEREQSMNPTADTSACVAANLDVSGLYGSLTLPSEDLLDDVSFTWAQLPNVTSAPAVVEGVVQ